MSGGFVLTKDVANKALAHFENDYNCAQAVFKAILDHKGIALDRATDLAAGFGGGISFSGQQCGAISGGLMSIGVLVGETITDVRDHKWETFRLCKEFQKRFTEKFGTIRCDDLTGINMSDENALTKAIDEGVFSEICPKFVGWSAETVLELVS